MLQLREGRELCTQLRHYLADVLEQVIGGTDLEERGKGRPPNTGRDLEIWSKVCRLKEEGVQLADSKGGKPALRNP